LTDGGGAAQRIDIPKSGLDGKILYSDFAGHFRSRLAAPYDAELGFGAFIENIDDVSRFQTSVHALQSGTAATDGAQAGRLSERAEVGVHAPDVYGEINENARLLAAIHAILLRDPEGGSGIVDAPGEEAKVTPVPSRGVPKDWLPPGGKTAGFRAKAAEARAWS
jgi:hypothetical protein